MPVKFHQWIGLAGVHPDENLAARTWGRRLEIPMLVVALWLLISWYIDTKNHPHLVVQLAQDWIIWLFFVVELGTITLLADDKWRYLKGNWLNLVIILAGVPLLWGDGAYAGALRSLRLLLAVTLLLQMSGTVKHVLSSNHLGATLIVAFFIITIAGIVIAGIDPAINDPIDGIWWAWVTVTTVGYGDIVPVSTEGKLFAGLLIVLGIGLFSLITANFSAFLITRGEEEEIESRLDRLDRLEKKIDEISDLLKKGRD
jgi:voltage-gated potassium channel